MTGMTQSRYQRSYLIDLPKPGPWDIKVTRTTAKITLVEVQNDFFWDSYTELIDDRINMNGTAVAALFLDSEQFSTLPKRTYYVYGILVQIPVNYDGAGGYSGAWDGTFKWGWTDNPAWILYDLLLSPRHGLGQFLQPGHVDKWSLYQAGQWCDQYVPNGKGGYERRFTCNIQIMDAQEAFDLIAQIAGIFRGFTYWSGSQMVAVADQPSDPVHQFTNANVIDGQFSYSGSDLRARHTMATVAWNDPAQLGQPRLAVVEDPDGISRFGIQKVEIQAAGCTSEAQAIRTGRWALYTELYEGEAVTFSTGLESAFARPGQIVQVMDANVSGKRRGGRIGAGSTASHIVFDAPVGMPVLWEQGLLLSCIIGSAGQVETQYAVSIDPGGRWVDLVSPFSAAPLPDTVFVLNEPGNLEPTLWRVIGVKQQEADKYEINAVRHFPDKWNYVEYNIPITPPDISDIPLSWPAVTNLAIREYLIQTSSISVGTHVVLSWVSQAPSFIVEWRPKNGNWSRTTTDAKAIDLPVSDGTQYEFRVTPVSALGVKGPMASLTYQVIGRWAPPGPPQQFRINVVDAVAMFDWLPAPEIDVIIGGHYQLRHTNTTSGATWNTAQVVIPSIPGNATSVETGYVPGTWMLRTFDITGTPSAGWATIIAYQQDGRYFQWQRICENPAYLGTRNNTEVRLPQQWLAIQDVNHGMWDAQLDNMDGWTSVDSLPVPPGTEPGPNQGSYIFSQRFDAGAPFSIRLTSDILAFPFGDPDDFFDSRLTDSDSWDSWDDTSANLGGQVTLLIRSTLDDPASASAVWTDWKTFISGEQYGRGFEFQAVLNAPPGENIGIETLCILGDFKAKQDEGQDVPYPAADTTVNFRIKFYNVPAVVITTQDATETDRMQVIAKTRDYFTLRITNPSGVQQTRTFDWHAQGY
jgi:hypothetical protein